MPDVCVHKETFTDLQDWQRYMNKEEPFQSLLSVSPCHTDTTPAQQPHP